MRIYWPSGENASEVKTGLGGGADISASPGSMRREVPNGTYRSAHLCGQLTLSILLVAKRSNAVVSEQATAKTSPLLSYAATTDPPTSFSRPCRHSRFEASSVLCSSGIGDPISVRCHRHRPTGTCHPSDSFAQIEPYASG